jgi:nucleoid DNA-binding protein
MRQNLAHLLINELVALGFRRTDAALAYKGLVDVLARHLLEGDNVNIRGLGTFYVGDRKPQVVDTPFTNGPTTVGPKKLLHFRPSPVFKDLLNGVFKDGEN